MDYNIIQNNEKKIEMNIDTKAPFFSIYIPVYNASKYIRQCVDSILNQTFTDYDLFLFDDLSADDSYDICCEYASKYSFIKCGRRKSRDDDYIAQNDFVEKAKGRFIVFVDNDDYLDSNHLKNIYDRLVQSNADCAIVAYKLVDEAGNRLNWYEPQLEDGKILDSYDVRRAFLTTLNIEGFRWNKICKRSVYIDNNIKMDRMFPQDIPFAYEVVSNIKSCVLVAEKSYSYRQRSNSHVAMISLESARGMLDMQRRISEIAISQGLHKEGSYYRTYRAIFSMYERYKSRKQFELESWKKLKQEYNWKSFIGNNIYRTIATLMEYPEMRDGRGKFIIKVLIVRWAYR